MVAVVIRVEFAHSGADGLCSMLLREMGLEPDAQPDEIRGRYRALVRETHPDKGGDPADFRKVHARYTTLAQMGRV